MAEKSTFVNRVLGLRVHPLPGGFEQARFAGQSFCKLCKPNEILTKREACQVVQLRVQDISESEISNVPLSSPFLPFRTNDQIQ